MVIELWADIGLFSHCQDHSQILLVSCRAVIGLLLIFGVWSYLGAIELDAGRTAWHMFKQNGSHVCRTVTTWLAEHVHLPFCKTSTIKERQSIYSTFLNLRIPYTPSTPFSVSFHAPVSLGCTVHGNYLFKPDFSLLSAFEANTHLQYGSYFLR
jgi:hypothetical protein